MHIGIIPDGNRRWAKEHGAALSEAYSIGFDKVLEVAMCLSKIGVRQITFFGMSHDNFIKRPTVEVEEILSQTIGSMMVSAGLRG